jgi:hypothetical protein
MVEILLGIIIWFQFINWYKDSEWIKRFKTWNDLRKRKKKVPKEVKDVSVAKLGAYKPMSEEL